MHDLIQSLYETAILGDKWGELLGKFGDHFGAKGGGLFAIVGTNVRGKFGGEFARLDEEVFPLYEMNENSRGNRLLAFDYPGFVTELDVMTHDDLMKDVVYRQELLPRNCIAAVGTKIAGLDDDTLAFSIEGFSSFDDAYLAIPQLDLLRPHIARATALSARLDLERAKNMTDALEAIGVAAAIINYSGRLKSANSMFEPLLGKSFFDFNNHISLANIQSNELLQKTIAEISISSQFARSIPIGGTDVNDARILHFVPLIGEVLDIFTGGNIMIFANKVKNADLPKVSQIRALFDLTPTESEIARKIALGNSSAQIASGTNRSVHTVRTHIKRILSKTGISSQRELLLLLQDLAN